MSMDLSAGDVLLRTLNSRLSWRARLEQHRRLSPVNCEKPDKSTSARVELQANERNVRGRCRSCWRSAPVMNCDTCNHVSDVMLLRSGNQSSCTGPANASLVSWVIAPKIAVVAFVNPV